MAGASGIAISYDAGGRRQTASYGTSGNREIYSYDQAGNLTSVAIGAVGSEITRAETSYDLLGRVTAYTERNASGAGRHERYDIVYDKRGLVLAEKTKTLQGSGSGAKWVYAHTANYYTRDGLTDGSAAAMPSHAGSTGRSEGEVLWRSETRNWKTTSGTLPAYGGSADDDLADSSLANTYVWSTGDGQSGGQAGPTLKTSALTNEHGTSTSGYWRYAGGAMRMVGVSGGNRPHRVDYLTDAAGRVLQRSDSGVNAAGGPVERYYRFDGIEMGTIGNDGTGNTDYDQAITDRNLAPGTGAFRNGAATGTAFADFDQSYVAVNAQSQAASSGSYYTIQAGDTLQGIAQAVWGDASLWYLIAEANGLSSGSTLLAGQGLVIPSGGAGTTGAHNTASTIRPYDAAHAMGDVQPGTPRPPKKNGCGGIGAILMAVVAIAVAVILPQAIPALAPSSLGGGVGGAVLSGAIGGAAGSAVSQGVGIAAGIQDKFSFKGVALAALGGAIGGGLPEIPGVGSALKGIGKSMGAGLMKAVQGIATGALTQGIGVATGLQGRFDWAGVAAGGVSAGIAQGIGGGPVLSNTAGGFAASAAQSLVTGRSFGDTLMGNLPGIIGNTVGSLMAGAVTGNGQREPLSISSGEPIDVSGVLSQKLNLNLPSLLENGVPGASGVTQVLPANNAAGGGAGNREYNSNGNYWSGTEQNLQLAGMQSSQLYVPNEAYGDKFTSYLAERAGHVDLDAATEYFKNEIGNPADPASIKSWVDFYNSGHAGYVTVIEPVPANIVRTTISALADTSIGAGLIGYSDVGLGNRASMAALKSAHPAAVERGQMAALLAASLSGGKALASSAVRSMKYVPAAAKGIDGPTGPYLADVWRAKPMARGNWIERFVAKNDYSDANGWYNVGGQKNGFFPLVDFQKGQNLVSLKTVDTRSSTWLSRMEDHIGDLGRNGATVSGKPANMILDLRVQPGGTATASRLIQFGRANNVTVVIKDFK